MCSNLPTMTQPKICESLVVEIRPRLQSVNVFIILSDTSKAGTKVKLYPTHFEVLQENKVQKVFISDSFQIVPESLSYFNVENNYVIFRFSTNNANSLLGTAKFEVMENDSIATFIEGNTFLKRGIEYYMHCSNCLQLLSQQTVFNRVLPLPSENYEPSEWFCHQHDTNINLVPGETDIFYSLCYAHVNKALFKTNCIIETSSNILCKRCFSWIGNVLKSEIFKVWFNTIIFKNKEINHLTEPLSDVFRTIEHIFKTESILNSHKILFCCQSSIDHTDYILLWIMEKVLKVYLDTDIQNNGICNVAKVLFRFENSENDTISQWKKNSFVSVVSVSKVMMTKLLKHLYKMNRYIPTNFGVSNGFYVSYLKMYKEFHR